jgi:hypothetical protein
MEFSRAIVLVGWSVLWLFTGSAYGASGSFCRDVREEFEDKIFVAREPLYDTEIDPHGIRELERDDEEIRRGDRFRVKRVWCGPRESKFILEPIDGLGDDKVDIVFLYPRSFSQGEGYLDRFWEMASRVFAREGESLDRPTPGRRTPKPVPAEDTAELDRDAPMVYLPAELRTTADRIEISGKVIDSSEVRELRVEGKPVEVSPDGVFEISRHVPLGQTPISVESMDEWGNSSRVTMNVIRELSVPETAVSSLDPFARHGRPKLDAVAIIIGIEDYEYAPPAEFASNDARLFYDFATNALGISSARVHLLLNADATERNVKRALTHWLPARVVPGKTTAFIFFAGHGMSAPDGNRFYLLPRDGDPELLEDTAINRSELLSLMADAGVSRTVAMIDACYSGLGRGDADLVAGLRPIRLVPSEASVPDNVTLLSAADLDEVSGSFPDAGHGLFSYYTMRGLEGAADEAPSGNGDQAITASELFEYLRANVARQAELAGRSQNPQLSGAGDVVLVDWQEQE